MIDEYSRGIFRETIDLNRFSNAVEKKYAITYNKKIYQSRKN
ncbi:MAG: hypothetical protein CM15mV107_280 [Caudoviricetes sp.]|nr:MAG: hypothetical protein CM15mV107_280 [Caudoviricetes sp.]